MILGYGSLAKTSDTAGYSGSTKGSSTSSVRSGSSTRRSPRPPWLALPSAPLWLARARWSRRAADLLQHAGLSIEVIDLRTLWPWDRDLVLDRAARTKRLIIAHESVRDVGLGAEIAATVSEELHDTLLAPVRRIASPRIPVGYAVTLENEYRVTAARIAEGVADLLGMAMPSENGPAGKPLALDKGAPGQ